MRSILTTLLLLFSMSLQAQYWGKNTESEFTNEAMDIEVDANGNSYIAGYITGETAFEIGVVQPSAAGNGDIYVAKYGSTGSLIWIKQFGGNYSDRAYDLAIDDNNNIYVTGQYFGQVDFDGNQLQSIGNSKDIFLIKMNPAGDVIWAISEGGASAENAYGITTDGQNNVVLTGQFVGNSTIAGQTFNSIIDPALGLPSNDLFISKYDTNGNPLWVVVGQAEYEDRGLAVHTDAQNNIFMTGQFSDTMVFAGQTFNNNGYNVGFLAKFSPTGQLQFFNTLRAAMVMPYDLEVNSSNEVVVIGDFKGNLQYTDANSVTLITNPYDDQIFVIKTQNNGLHMWNNTLGSDNDVSARSVSINTAKDVFITGYFKCGWSQLRENQESIFNSIGFKDPYLWKLTDTGQSTYVKQFGGKKDDEGHGVAMKNTTEPIICGSYTQDLNITRAFGSNYSTSNNDFDLTSYSVIEPSHLFLHGDNSRNSFLTNAVQQFTPTYNFFDPQGVDSLYGNIIPDLDTVHFCVQDSIHFYANTFAHMGPGYNYSWNTGSTFQGIWVNTTGLYDVDVERWDGCSSGEDTIYVEIHQLPLLPLMSDNLGLAINEPGINFYNYQFCAPDSVVTWFNGMNPTYTIAITDQNGLYNNTDTLPHLYNTEGFFDVTVTDSFCSNWGWFEIDFDYILPYDVVPYMVLVDYVDFNDSITVCLNDEVTIHILDSLENPNGIFYLFPTDSVEVWSWTITPSSYYISEADTFELEFHPQVTGWYAVTYTSAFGYDNLCGLDTTVYTIVDSFYVEVNPLPMATATISRDNLLCPNGSVYLVTSNVINGLSWYGPSINWVSSNGDSIQVTEAGVYHYWGNMVDTVTMCSSYLDFIHVLTEKVPPNVQTDPSDGIVCPNDSVLMWVDSIYMTYEWTGPEGDSLSLTSQHIDDDQGFYYCTVLDNEGCYLTTPPFELREYATPYLAVEPTNIICADENVTIMAIFSGDGQVSWTSPIISNNEQIITNQPGWYYCELTSCGITLQDSIEIIDGSFSIDLTLSDSILCYGEDAVLSATPGLGTYEWNTGDVGMPMIIIENEGSYWVSVMNNYGCEANSDTVFVDFIEESIPPVIADQSLCFGAGITISNPGAQPTEWYTIDSTLILIGQSISLPNITEDSNFLAAYNVPQCPTSYDVFTITIIDSIPDYEITGDATICSNGSSTFSVNSNGETTEWFIDGQLMGASSSITLDASAFANSSILELVVSNNCFTVTLTDSIQIIQPDEIALQDDSLILCNYDNLLLTIQGVYDSIFWSGDFGQITTNDLFLNAGFNPEFIYVSAVDLSGCGTNSDSIFVDLSSLAFTLTDDMNLNCEGDLVTVEVITTTDSLVWTTPIGIITDSSFTVQVNDANAGWYLVTLWDNVGCMYTDSLNLISNPLPLINLPEDTMLCSRDYFSVPGFNDSLIYSWQNYGVQDSIMVTYDQWLVVMVTNPSGCIIKDSIYIDIVDCDDPLPNVITSNGDGVNDFFIIDEAPLYPNNSLIIFNRWGNVVYEEDGYMNMFNGGELTDGVYFYVFYREGRNTPEIKTTGNLTIVR